MKLLHSVPLIVSVLLFVIVLASCDSTTEVNYLYQPSFHVVPTEANALGKRQLSLKLLIQTPQRGCWEIDKVLFSTDSDKVTGMLFVQNDVSIKRPVSASCPTEVDTLFSKETITFQKAGTYTIRFTQLDSRGTFINKEYKYDIKD